MQLLKSRACVLPRTVRYASPSTRSAHLGAQARRETFSLVRIHEAELLGRRLIRRVCRSPSATSLGFRKTEWSEKPTSSRDLCAMRLLLILYQRNLTGQLQIH
jgi:hypothetical protein